LRASARSLSLCLAFYKPRLSAFSNLLFARVLHLRHSSLIQCRLPCSVAQLRRISTTPPSFHSISIGPASAATTGGFLLTALSNARRRTLPPCTFPRKRASDKALTSPTNNRKFGTLHPHSMGVLAIWESS